MPLIAESSRIPPPQAVAQAEPLTPTALAPEALARILTAAGGKTITTDMVRAAIDAGAPVGVGGRINLVELTAWMEWELALKF